MNAATSPLRMALASLCTLAAPMGLAAEDAGKGPPRYTVTDLGTLGGTFSQGVGVSNDGTISGFATPIGDLVVHAFIWRKGVMTDLGTLGGPNSLAPEEGPPSERDEVAGVSETSDPNGDGLCQLIAFSNGSGNVCRPFVWRRGTMTELPTLGGSNAVAYGINNRGQAVGTSETAIADPDCAALNITQTRSAIWETKTGQVHALQPLVGDTISLGQAINDKGQSVGTSGTCAAGPIEAVMWNKDGTPIDLGTLGGAVFNVAFSVNNRGQAVGQSNLLGNVTHHAVLWEKGAARDLGTLYGLTASLATWINNNGEVVGFAQDSENNTVAFLWRNGTMTDLNTLIPPMSPVFLIEALGINDRGQITGYMLDIPSGETHGFLATPVEGSEDTAPVAQARGSETPRVVLPEKTREMLRHQHHWPR